MASDHAHMRVVLVKILVGCQQGIERYHVNINLRKEK